uniref:NKAP domain containing 1 n=1 Tax=Anolis carolinensis TaxID=28377 RepID=H9GMA4_ANOCA
MSHVPLGKVLLRNVIRHTGAHNKIQEESEMWKIREMEKQSKDIYWGKQPRMLSKSSSNRMRSDGFDEEQGNCKARSLASMSAVEEDLRHARYWNKKLYEYEANMPDRYRNLGYRELYPEEFDTDR